MKQFLLTAGGPLLSLERREAPLPEPGANEVRVRIKAVSLNYRDIMIAKGMYPGVEFPLVPFSDGAGIVEAVGGSVTRVKEGDRVCPIFMQTWLHGGFRAEYSPSSLGGQSAGVLSECVCVAEDGVVRIPEHLGFEQAATLPCAAVTAWNALFERGALKPGMTVLLQGTGGVS
ncbi:MAG: NAD(P)-dependent alcohol dehydrogenase, partial [Bdellovibrionales bacterium]|nr:NAD(P)-dependent alcohol dehydrogenase [Bdellovibrionales bacterium]